MFSARTKFLAVAVVTASVLAMAGNVDACRRGWFSGYGRGGACMPAYSVGYAGSYGGCFSCDPCSSCGTFAPAGSGCPGGMCGVSYYAGYPAYSTYYGFSPSSYSTYYGFSPGSYSTYYWLSPGSYSTYYWLSPGSYESSYPVYYSAPVFGDGCTGWQGSTISYHVPFWTTSSSTPKAVPASDSDTLIAFSVRVPRDARVYVNDRPTTSTGTERRYVARGLKPGSRYGFTVRTERTIDGRTLSETQVLRLTAGQSALLAFSLQPAQGNVAARPSGVLVKLAAHR